MLSIEKKGKKSVLVYKLFLSLNIRDFSLFFVKNWNCPCPRPPFPPPAERRGAHYVMIEFFVIMRLFMTR